jgi:hypothetical protein
MWRMWTSKDHDWLQEDVWEFCDEYWIYVHLHPNRNELSIRMGARETQTGVNSWVEDIPYSCSLEEIKSESEYIVRTYNPFYGNDLA